jgi:hypothetical protein
MKAKSIINNLKSIWHGSNSITSRAPRTLAYARRAKHQRQQYQQSSAKCARTGMAKWRGVNGEKLAEMAK